MFSNRISDKFRTTVLFTFCCLLCPPAVSIIAAPCNKDSRQKDPIEMPRRGLCAHRGAMDSHPENTLAAFRQAVRLGAHMIEFDVQLTQDNQLVIMHDDTVDRTTNGKGKVSQLTLAQLKELDAGSFKSAQFKNERIPTLQETLAVMPENIWLNVHLKGGKELAQKAAKLIIKENRQHQTFLACDSQAGKAARALYPNILICNMSGGDAWQYVDQTLAVKAQFIQLQRRGDAVPDYRHHIQKLKANGIRVNYFGTDSPEVLRKLFDMGVDFPLVNKIEPLIKTVEKLGIQPVEPRFPSNDGSPSTDKKQTKK